MDEYKEHLENCYQHEVDSQKTNVESFAELLDQYSEDFVRVIEASHERKIGFVEEARRIFTEARSQVIENRVRMNEELQRSVIRITGAALTVFFLGMGLVAIKSAVDNQFCEFYNV